MKDIRTNTPNRLERTHAVNAFLNDIRKYKTPTSEENTALAIAAKGGDQKAQDELVTRNQLFVFSICNNYASGEDILDLVSVATIGMIKAISGYDASKGGFLTYAVNYMAAEINQYLFEVNPVVRRTNVHLIGNKANVVRREFYAEYGYEPTDDEVAELLEEKYGISVDAADVVKFNTSHFEDENGEDGTIEDSGEVAVRSASSNGYESTMEREDIAFKVSALMGVLSAREQEVIAKSFGIGCEYEHDLEDIATDLGLTKMRICQIRNEALSKLRRLADAASIAM